MSADAPPSQSSPPPALRLGPALAERDIVRLERDVLPRYLSFFSTLAMSMLVPSDPASVVVIGSRAGLETDLLSERLPRAKMKGLESSEAGVRAATQRISSLALASTFEVARGLPTQQSGGLFTHALSIHPMASRAVRKDLLTEMHRLLVRGGQAIVSLPLRGSFPEIVDMVREYAQKYDLAKLGEAIDIATSNRPTPETISDELESVGFTDVDVDVQLLSVRFASGADLVEHAVYELIVAPDARAYLELAPAVVNDALDYVEAAIRKYWSAGELELTVNVGAASGRRAAAG
jgi:trans-aconitate methyltransferase